MLNEINLIGRLGKDPVLKTIGSTSICNFTMCTSFKSKDGTKNEWHRVVAFGKLAELCNKYIYKGSLVHVRGRIQTNKYEKDGQTRYSTEIITNDVIFLDQKPKENDFSASSIDENEEMPF